MGLELLDEVGRDSIMFETDYPHQDGTFAETSQVARGDALRWFGLDLPA